MRTASWLYSCVVVVASLFALASTVTAQDSAPFEISVQLVGSLNEPQAARAVTALNRLPSVSNARVHGGIIELNLAPGGTVAVSAIDAIAASIVPGTRVERGRLRFPGPFDLVLASSHDPANDAAILTAFQSIRFVSNVALVSPRRFSFELASGRTLQASALLQKYLTAQPPGGRVLIEELLHDIVFHAPGVQAAPTTS